MNFTNRHTPGQAANGYTDLHADFPADPQRSFSAIQHRLGGNWDIWEYDRRLKHSGVVHTTSSLEEAKAYIEEQATPAKLAAYHTTAKSIIRRERRKSAERVMRNWNVDELADAGSILGHGGDW